jgi:hypothetical protein
MDNRKFLRVLDPYSGVGTSAISLTEMVRDGDLSGAAFYGFESNPFIHFVGSTKLKASQNPSCNVLRLAQKVAATVLKGNIEAPPPPDLSTFKSDRFFDQSQLKQLLCIREAINIERSKGSGEIDLALAELCLASIIEPTSNLRRDGRALRVVEKRRSTSAIQLFLDRANDIQNDLPSSSSKVRGRIIRSDGRSMTEVDARYAPFDLAIFSPPYPNNIDYTEVYKLEGWLLGHYEDSQAFRAQRMRTVYSHPSLLRPDPLPSEELTISQNSQLESVISPVVRALPQDQYLQARTRMLRGYCLDMFRTLQSVNARLDENGRAVYIVGNSVHGHAPDNVIVAADIIIAELAKLAGFGVDHFEVARLLKRRDVNSPILRESVVFLRKAS